MLSFMGPFCFFFWVWMKILLVKNPSCEFVSWKQEWRNWLTHLPHNEIIQGDKEMDGLVLVGGQWASLTVYLTPCQKETPFLFSLHGYFGPSSPISISSSFFKKNKQNYFERSTKFLDLDFGSIIFLRFWISLRLQEMLGFSKIWLCDSDASF